MLELYGRNNSSNVQTVLIALHEMALPFKRHDAGLAFGVNNTPEYLRRNPNGLVPMLNDGALDVWETNTILRYLAQKHEPTPLYPTDAAARSHVERWMDWRQTTFGPAINVPFLQYIRVALEKRDMPLVRAKEVDAVRCMKMLDAQLEGKSFITGEAMTMADITLTIFVHRFFVLPLEVARPPLPNVERWIAHMRVRASVKPYTDMVLT
jgi:glutathione S-transferase